MIGRDVGASVAAVRQAARNHLGALRAERLRKRRNAAAMQDVQPVDGRPVALPDVPCAMVIAPIEARDAWIGQAEAHADVALPMPSLDVPVGEGPDLDWDPAASNAGPVPADAGSGAAGDAATGDGSADPEYTWAPVSQADDPATDEDGGAMIAAAVSAPDHAPDHGDPDDVSSPALAVAGAESGCLALPASNDPAPEGRTASGPEEPAAVPDGGKSGPQGLADLPGIGPGLVWIFGQSNIHTLPDLAAADPVALRKSLGLIGELIDIDDWIARARAAGG